jgi:hypothetical protein
LHPQRAAHFARHLLHARDGPGGEGKRDTRGLGGPRELELAAIPHHSGRTGRGDADRHPVLLTEERRVELASGDVHQHAGQELDVLERFAIVVERDFLFRAAIDELEQPLREAPFRHLPQVENVVCVFHSRENHDVRLCLPLRCLRAATPNFGRRKSNTWNYAAPRTRRAFAAARSMRRLAIWNSKAGCVNRESACCARRPRWSRFGETRAGTSDRTMKKE